MTKLPQLDNIVELVRKSLVGDRLPSFEGAPEKYISKIPDRSFDELAFCNFQAQRVYFDIGSWDDTKFSAATFDNCFFFGSLLMSASFCDVSMSRTVFYSTALFCSKFTSCKLDDVSFLGCTMSDMVFDNCVFKNVQFGENNMRSKCETDGLQMKNCILDDASEKSYFAAENNLRY